jgi:hypothetical protein
VSTANEIADLSLKLANEFLDGARNQVRDMADGDTDRLREAAELVRDQAGQGPALSHSAEHLAFSLITAAHSAMLDEYRAAEKPPD